jgi:hypothetical protein
VEEVEIAEYRAAILDQTSPDGFKKAVIADLERRRDQYCPTEDRFPKK